jgi:hypothetical protein
MWDFSKVSTKGLQRDEFLENDYKIVSLKKIPNSFANLHFSDEK